MTEHKNKTATGPHTGQRAGLSHALTLLKRVGVHGSAAGIALVSIALALAGHGALPTRAFIPAMETALSQRTGGEVQLADLFLSINRHELHVDVADIGLQADYQARLSGIHATAPLDGLLSQTSRFNTFHVAEVEANLPEPKGRAGGPEPLPFEAILTQLSRGAGKVSLPKINMTYGGDEAIALVDASVTAAPSDEGYVISASLPFDVSGMTTAAALDVYARPGGITDLQLTSDGAPIQPLLSLAGVDAVRLDSSFDGQLALSVDASGTPIGGAIDIRLKPGEGQIAAIPFIFGQNSLDASFDGFSPKFEINELRYDVADNQGVLVGSVAADRVLTPSELVLEFDVIGAGIHLDLGSILEGPLDVDRVTARGVFDASTRYLGFEELTSTFFGSALSGTLALTFPEGFEANPRIESEAVLPGPLTPQQVLAAWPRPLAASARGWVAENLTGGKLTQLKYESDIPMGAVRKRTPLDDDTMRFTFNAADATVRYLSDMPPIRRLKASAIVRGNSFRVNAERGEVSGVLLAGGMLDMPRFMPDGATARFTSRLVGEVPVILNALEDASLVTFDDDGYQPEAFQGQGTFDLSIAWPLVSEPAMSDVKVTGSGAFARAAIDNVLPGIDASDAEGRVILTPQRLVVRGSGLAASAPATFEWRQALTGRQRADLSVSAEVDAVAADMIGLPLREFFDGAVIAQVEAHDLTPGAPLMISGDLTRAEVNIPQLGLRKPRGTEGSFEATAVLPDAESNDPLAGLVGLSDLTLSSPQFQIEGNGVFTPEGGMVRLELPTFFIEDQADFALRLMTDDGALEVGMSGAYADATPILDEIFGSTGVGGRLPGQSHIDFDLERVSLRSGVVLRNVKAVGEHDGEGFDSLVVSAAVNSEDRLSVTLDRPLGEEVGYVEIESTDFGTLARGVFGLRTIEGAPGSIKGATLTGGGFSGRFETSELIVKEAPTLARLLSVGSLDGLSDLLSGEGIRFEKLEGDVWLQDGKLGLADAKLVGSSLGISATGVVDLESGMIDVRGAIAPAYAVNSILGSLPGIGRLFVSREGEGVLAFAYQLSGPIEQPTITVNTLAALTPGILRRIFEPVEDGAAGTQKWLDAAIAAAREEASLAAPNPRTADERAP